MNKVLSLDGGGSRGVLSICMLKNVEQLLVNTYGVANVYIQSYFDYITGTSIGGLEAAALSVADEYGNFKYNATYLCDELSKKSLDIFSDHKWFSGGGVFRSQYHRESLTKVLEDLLGDTKLSETKIPISMHALKLGTNEPVTWSTYLARCNPQYDYRLVDVAEATSAAPTYFDPKMIDGNNYVDGGVFANDPIVVGLATFIRYNPSFDRHNTFVLSVGTGKKIYDQDNSHSGALTGTSLLDIIDVIFESNKNSQFISSLGVLDNYFKLDPEIREDIYKLDVTSARVIEEYRDIADKYMNDFVKENPQLMEQFFLDPSIQYNITNSSQEEETLGNMLVLDEL